MLLFWMVIMSLITLVLFVGVLFAVTLSYTNDIQISFVILVTEIGDFLFVRKKKKIEAFQSEIDNDLKKRLKRVVKKKDSELMELFSMSREEASSFKAQIQRDLNDKDIHFVTKDEVKLFLESEDLLSFIGSYKSSLEIFSNKENIQKFKKESRNNKISRIKQYEEVYEYRISKDKGSFDNFFDEKYRVC
ncbi:hypothetical protein IGJ55_002072 [Enterococcus sp. AZ170]|uniref:hypothetical protein n=1 Tax=Enterococcus sp. AZ170 TaxID=2774747 RepID=UPI003D300E29